MDLPEKMRAVQLPGPDMKLEWNEVDIPELEKGEVLVKMHASPINPSDLSFLTGRYTHIPKFPVTPGIEGSGVVVKAKGGFMAKRLLGKNVICSPSKKGGTWAEYMATGAMKCIPVGAKISLDEAATLIVNPLTALSMLGHASNTHRKGVVINAAASSLGQMIIKLAKKQNVNCVAIVRKTEQIAKLKQLGASAILVSTTKDFANQLAEKIKEYEVGLALDAVSGEMSNILLKALPKGGELKIYGRLAGEAPEIDPKEMIQNDKTISGFYLANHMQQLNLLSTLKLIGKAKKLVHSELQSNIFKTLKMEEVNEAIAEYKRNMSAGKILLKP